MALKAVIDSIEALPEYLQSEYTKGEDGKFHLNLDGVEGHHQVGALKRAKDREATERKELSDRLAKLTEERDGLLKSAVPKGDVAKLEASYNEKIDLIEKQLKGENSQLTSALNTLLVDNVATSLAHEISIAPELILPHLRSRLKADYVDGRGVTRVLDKEGNISAANIGDLKKELLDNPIFAPIIKGTKATGSNAQSNVHKSSAPSDKQYVDMTPAEMVAHFQNRS